MTIPLERALISNRRSINFVRYLVQKYLGRKSFGKVNFVELKSGESQDLTKFTFTIDFRPIEQSTLHNLTLFPTVGIDKINLSND